jgi:predicted PurR-regulated permease PerM
MLDSLRPPTRPWMVPPADTPSIRGLLTLAVSVVVVAGLYVGREVLIPITLAILLSFVLAPLVGLLRRARLGRIASVILAVVISLGVILAIGGVIGTQVADLANDIPRYQTTVRHKIDTIRGFTIERLWQPLAYPPEQVTQAGRSAADLQVRDAHHRNISDVEGADTRARHRDMGDDAGAQGVLTEQLCEHSGC